MGLKVLRPELLTGETFRLNCYVEGDVRYHKREDKYSHKQFPMSLSVEVQPNTEDLEKSEVKVLEDTSRDNRLYLLPVERAWIELYFLSYYNLVGDRDNTELYYWLPLTLDEETGEVNILAFGMVNEGYKACARIEKCLISEWLWYIGKSYRLSNQERTDDFSMYIYSIDKMMKYLQLEDRIYKKLTSSRVDQTEGQIRYNIGDKLYNLYRNSQEQMSTALMFNSEKEVQLYNNCKSKLLEYAPRYVYDGFGNHLGYSFELWDKHGDKSVLSDRMPDGNEMNAASFISVPHRIVRLNKKNLKVTRLDYCLARWDYSVWLLIGLGDLLDDAGIDEQQVWYDCNKIAPFARNGRIIVNFLIDAETLVKYLPAFIRTVSFEGLPLKDIYYTELNNIGISHRKVIAYTRDGKPKEELSRELINLITVTYSSFINNLDKVMGALYEHYDDLSSNKTVFIEILDADSTTDITEPISAFYTAIRLLVSFSKGRGKSSKITLKYFAHGASYMFGDLRECVVLDSVQASEPLGKTEELYRLLETYMKALRQATESIT